MSAVTQGVCAAQRERASMAGCAQRHTGYGFEILLADAPAHAEVGPWRARAAVPDGERRRSGEAVRCASSAAVTPACAPQPEPSFSIVGWSQTRRIWPRGPKYSAMPSACRAAASSSAQQPGAERGAASAFQAPEQW